MYVRINSINIYYMCTLVYNIYEYTLYMYPHIYICIYHLNSYITLKQLRAINLRIVRAAPVMEVFMCTFYIDVY